MPSTLSLTPRTLADAMPLPRHLSPIPAEALRLSLGVLLVAALAQISVPLPGNPVPLTGQTLGVLLCGLLLGSRRGFLALSLYLGLGAIGVPVFAGYRMGLGFPVSPTDGYLYIFPIAAFVIGWFAERGWDRRPLTAALAMFLGSVLILSVGSLWLSLFVGGVPVGFAKGFLPFLPGEFLKIGFVAILLPGLWKTQRRTSAPM